MKMLSSNPRNVLAALAFAACATFVSCSSNSTSPSSPTPTPTTTPAAAADVTVAIVGMAGANSYNPSPAAVRVGQTVSWRNADSVSHTATGNGFDTGAIAPGATSAPITFGSAGTLNYRCTFHPSMTGVLNVAP
jgi:plastocyanin